jgi:hypothetical protein
MTISIMTISIMTISIMTISIMTISIMTISIMTISITTLRVSKLRITTLGITIEMLNSAQWHSITDLIATLSVNDIKHNGMECHYAECYENFSIVNNIIHFLMPQHSGITTTGLMAQYKNI